MKLVEKDGHQEQETRDWLATFVTVVLPDEVDSYDLGATLYNALHETSLEAMRHHVQELAHMLGYTEVPRGGN